MTPAWLPFATLMVAVIGVGITIVLNTRAQGRIEGTITQGLASPADVNVTVQYKMR